MSLKILAAVDSAADRIIVQKALKEEYCLLTVGAGTEVLRALNEHDEINLLILDLNVVNIEGLQVLEQVKKNGLLQKLRTIIITDPAEPDKESKGLKLGAVDYIRKPLQTDSLKARVLSMLLCCVPNKRLSNK